MAAGRSSRDLARNALREWRRSTRFADDILHELLAQSALSAADRAFATELFYGVLRNLRLLDFWITELRHGALEPDTRDIVRLGLLQLLILEAPAHAAVFETVELATARARNLVNAMLRTAQRNAAKLRFAAKKLPIAVRSSHPDFLIERWLSRFGDRETERLCYWNNEPPPIYIRVNQLTVSRADFAKRHRDADATNHPLFFRVAHLPLDALKRGECYAQDPSTALACELLNPQPNERLLDACAAPGGKTSYLAQLTANRGEIVAVDRDERRVHLLRENLQRLGITSAEYACLDWSRDLFNGGAFDKILLDAPCSNTGVMRRRVDVRWRLRPGDFVKMQQRQLAIARGVLAHLKSGGVIVYSTCSIEHEENEAVVQQLVREFPRLRWEHSASVLPFRDGVDGAFAARLRLA